MTKTLLITSIVLLGGTILFASTPSKNSRNKYQVPAEKSNVSNVDIALGGYGSDLAYNQNDSTFWLLTDRGPNVDNPSGKGKAFPMPEFAPNIKVFKLEDGKLKQVKKIELRDSNMKKFSGLPMKDATGRYYGIDPEGLAIAPDGSFWISEEYAPSLMHFSADGVLIKSLSPFDGGLPRRYANRRPNRGLEGLCMNQSTGTIYGMLQSPLKGDKSQNLPLFELQPNGKIRDFDYPLSKEAIGVSALYVYNDSTLLVLERDGEFPIDGKGFKRVFKTVIPKDTSATVLKKGLFVDIMKTAPSYNHDKAEGIALIGDSILVVANDDDFGITNGKGRKIIKKLKPDGTPDSNELWFIPIKRP